LTPTAQPAPQSPAQTANDMITVARAYEPERYLAATLAKEPARAALLAVTAFSADLHRITTTATQPVLGEIRLQWWRDSLDTLAKGGRTGAPLADSLGDAITAHALPSAMLIAMTEARAWDLYDDPMPDQPSLDGYLTKTEAIPFELALRVLKVPAGHAAQLAAPAGRIYGLTRILAHLPAALAAGRLPIPAAALTSYGLTPDALFAGTTTPAVHKLVSSMTQDIATQLAALQPQISALSKPQRVAMLPLATVAPYLTRISHTHRDPLRDIADLAPLARVWRITMAHLTGRFQARTFHADT
jgi:15-cis-phytoene synthase